MDLTGDGGGLIESGNIDLHNRPRVRNADGSISTVRSMSFNMDGQEVLVPTVSDDGRIMDDDEAVDTYRRTGRHLGKFRTGEAADAYAQQLHQDQEREYVGTEGSMAEDTPKGKLDDARAMVQKSGKPMTTENLNRASLALSQNKDTTEFDDKLEAMANPKPRGASTARTRTPASTGKDVATEDAKSVNANSNKPPETARAGDGPRPTRTPDRPAVAYNTEPTVNTTGEPVMPMPKPGAMTAGIPEYVDEMIANEQAGQNALAGGKPLIGGGDRVSNKTLSDLITGGSGGAQAASPPAGGPPEPGFLPQPDAVPPKPQGSFSDYLLEQGIMLPNGNLNMNSPAARDGSPAGMADTGMRAPRFPLARPPGFNGAPSPGLPPGSVNPPGANTLAGPPPQAALPSSFGPPIPRGLGNPNMATPPPSIPMQPGGTQAHLMPKPRMTVKAGSERQQNNMIANTEALVRALRARGSGVQQ